MSTLQATRPMTVGELSRRTGVPAKSLRAYTDWGLIYTVGRSPSNYRLYDEDALWCVRLIGDLRALGLTLAEIREMAQIYARSGAQPIGPWFAKMLHAARARVDAQIAQLQQTRQRIDAFVAQHQAALSGGDATELWGDDPRAGGKDA
jgi:MerR family copper efflux transcriptional regulator